MPKPICMKCQRFYRPYRNGIKFVEAMPIKVDAIPGTAEPQNWKPYKVWMADQWKCQGCGSEIIVGSGFRPIAIHHEDGFNSYLEKIHVAVQVNDC